MNIREGMRRLAVVLGIIGAVGGGYLGYLSGIDAWNAAWQDYKDYREFKSMVALPIIEKVIQAVKRYPGKEDVLRYANGAILKPPPIIPQDPNAQHDYSKDSGEVLPDDFVSGDTVVSVDDGGIHDILLNSTGRITVIRFTDGKTSRGDSLSISQIVMPLLYPLLGFVIPWGAIKTITWIGEGF